MSATVLISGKLFREPERKVSSAGKAYASATVRVGNGDDATWWKVLAFSESAAEEMLSLHDGDAIAATGGFKAEVYDRGAGPKVGFTLFADRAISARRAKKEKAAERRAEPKSDPSRFGRVEAQRPFNDEVPI